MSILESTSLDEKKKKETRKIRCYSKWYILTQSVRQTQVFYLHTTHSCALNVTSFTVYVNISILNQALVRALDFWSQGCGY